MYAYDPLANFTGGDPSRLLGGALLCRARSVVCAEARLAICAGALPCCVDWWFGKKSGTRAYLLQERRARLLPKFVAARRWGPAAVPDSWAPLIGSQTNCSQQERRPCGQSTCGPPFLITSYGLARQLWPNGCGAPQTRHRQVAAWGELEIAGQRHRSATRAGGAPASRSLHLPRIFTESVNIQWLLPRFEEQLDELLEVRDLSLLQSAEAARPRLERLMAQLELRGLRPSPLDFSGDNFRFELLPQVRAGWFCDRAICLGQRTEQAFGALAH